MGQGCRSERAGGHAVHGSLGSNIETAHQRTMIDFLIRRDDDEWFDFPFDRYPDVLRPLTIASRPVEGWGSHRIEVGGVEISFSDEDPGFQVSFETSSISAQRAREIVDDICRSIETKTGQKTRVVEL